MFTSKLLRWVTMSCNYKDARNCHRCKVFCGTCFYDFTTKSQAYFLVDVFFPIFCYKLRVQWTSSVLSSGTCIADWDTTSDTQTMSQSYPFSIDVCWKSLHMWNFGQRNPLLRILRSQSPALDYIQPNNLIFKECMIKNILTWTSVLLLRIYRISVMCWQHENGQFAVLVLSNTAIPMLVQTDWPPRQGIPCEIRRKNWLGYVVFCFSRPWFYRNINCNGAIINFQTALSI